MGVLVAHTRVATHPFLDGIDLFCPSLLSPHLVYLYPSVFFGLILPHRPSPIKYSGNKGGWNRKKRAVINTLCCPLSLSVLSFRVCGVCVCARLPISVRGGGGGGNTNLNSAAAKRARAWASDTCTWVCQNKYVGYLWVFGCAQRRCTWHVTF